MRKNKAFTLAELMIVLAVLGVIAAILTPVILSSMPNEKKVKFRKAHYVAQKAMEETINSSTYDNDEGVLTSDSAVLFCKTYADMLNTIGEVKCTETVPPKLATPTVDVTGSASLATFDTLCGTNSPTTPAFTTQDGVTWWGGIDRFDGSTVVDGIETKYVVMCFDVDGSGSEAPFGFGVRNDGKIIMGQRATTWLQEDVRDAIDNR